MTAGDIRFSTDPALLDRELVHTWLSTQAYWALGRSRGTQDAAIDGSLNVGGYDGAGRQVAYARVVTDGVVFAWLCDVFVAPEARGGGLGKRLVEAVLAELDARGVRRVLLRTEDAHGLYASFGFVPLDAPDEFLLRTAPEA